ncbi:TetR/AcrR family transcriptional regulator [Mycolicibacterium sp. XJ1819]
MAAPKRDRIDRPTRNPTRDRIIAAAEKLFDDVDIDKISVAEIADAAGIHRVTVYRHFADRDAIVDEVLDRRSKPILERAAARLDKADLFPDDLAYAMVTAVDETRRMPEVLKAMSLMGDGETFRTRATSERFLARAADVVRPHLVSAQESGRMRSDLSIDETVKWLLQVCLSWLFFSQDESPAKLLDTAKSYVMPALVSVESTAR